MIEEMSPTEAGRNGRFSNGGMRLDEFGLAEAEAESDVLDADLEDYEEHARRPEPEAMEIGLDEFGLAEADAES